jgi:hypothetical protein
MSVPAITYQIRITPWVNFLESGVWTLVLARKLTDMRLLAFSEAEE